MFSQCLACDCTFCQGKFHSNIYWATKPNLNLTSKSAHSRSECPLTLNPPSRSNVGSRPTEKIRRSIVEAMSARMPWGWGKTMTIARETSMAIHSRADRWGSRVPEDEGHIRKGCEHFHSWSKLLQQCFQQDLFFSSHASLPLRSPCQKQNFTIGLLFIFMK